MLFIFINSIKSQTSNNWFLRIIHDGNCNKYKELKIQLEKEGYLNEQVTLECTDKRYNDWGHSLRDYALKSQTKKSDFTIITNGDNYYLPNSIEAILDHHTKEPKCLFMYCNFVQRYDAHIHNTPRTCYHPMNTQLAKGNIDMGAVIVKTSVATEVGFNSRSFDADWKYIEQCLEKISSIAIQDVKEEWSAYKKIMQNLEEVPHEYIQKYQKFKDEKVKKLSETLFVHI